MLKFEKKKYSLKYLFSLALVLPTNYSFAENDDVFLPPQPAGVSNAITVPNCAVGDPRCKVCNMAGFCSKLTLCIPSRPGCDVMNPLETMVQDVFYDY